MKKIYFILLIIGLCVIASVLCFNHMGNPFVWIFLIYSIMFVAAASLKFGLKIQILFINCAVILLTFSIFEGYLVFKSSRPKLTTTYSSELYKSDDKLGWGAIKSTKVRIKKVFRDESVFDVSYTIDSNGLRVSQNDISNHYQECILFFGGSVTFGEGVNDEDAMPFRVGVKVGSKYRIYNFGFIGYGPHQMLAAIEFGYVEEVLKCTPKHIIFQTIPGHIKRASGQSSWGKYGPLYKIGKSGEAEFMGSFESNKQWNDKLSDIFAKSHIYSKIFGHQKSYSNDEIVTYLAIVRKARTLLISKYPNSTFHALYWDYNIGGVVNEKLKDGFNRDRIPLHLVSNIIPEFQSNSPKYVIKYDLHPNSLAHSLIAQYVINEIIN